MRVSILFIAVVCYVAAVNADPSSKGNNNRKIDTGKVTASRSFEIRKVGKQERENCHEEKTTHNDNRGGKKLSKENIIRWSQKKGRHDRDDSNDSNDSDNSNSSDDSKSCEEPAPACNTMCLMIADPLCAKPDGFEGDSKTFDNECQLGVYNCLNPNAKYKISSKGACKPLCPQVCPYYAAPFCATPVGWCAEPRTFENPCFLGIYNCENPDNQYKKFHDGVCLTTPAPEPDCGLIDCPQNVAPICAIPKGFCGQPQTFNNKCYLEVYNCFNPNEQYEIFHDGECFTTPAPEPECDETACPNDDNVICGLPDGFCGEPKTFANECYMKVYNSFNPNEPYKYFHDSACLNEPTSNCDSIVCTDDYIPFCGIPDGSCGEIRTFSNPCQLDLFNCNNPDTKYKYFHEKECLTTTTAAPEPNCAAISCSNEGPAVCGIPDGFCGLPQTFTNGCNMNVYNCFNPDQKYKLFHEGECKPQTPVCPTACPYNYAPICGSGQSGDLKTFPNKCVFESENCLNENNQYTFVHDGECDICANIKCNKIYQPVCATNSDSISETFGNPCQLQQYNCDNCDDEYQHSYDGVCSDPIICTLEYMPVCATSPTLGSKTFSNECEQNAYIAIHPEEGYAPDYDGECKQCKLACPKILAPICGINSNGVEKTFSNQCEYEKYNCLNPNDQYSRSYDGTCNKCKTACPRIYAPVCTNDGAGNEKTWANKCELESYNCRYPYNLYTVNYEGECNNCPTICPALHAPVCAIDSDGNEVEYSNQCTLGVYNCQHQNNEHSLAYTGQCNNCQTICPMIYEPVCAVDCNGNEVEYSNQCALGVYNCQHQNDEHSLAYTGECHNCNVACIDIYDPICTNDGEGNQKTWGNKCELESYNCRYPNNLFTVNYEGECNNCPTICPALYAPVCAVDCNGNEVEYSNECALGVYNCQHQNDEHSLAYTGQCNNCQSVCPAIYEPVCSVDCDGNEVQYSNPCLLEIYNCQHQHDEHSLAYTGECHNCQTVCPAIYAPVCAVDCNGFEVEYSNECALGVYNCQHQNDEHSLAYTGQCNNCQSVCPAIYEPVCSVDCDGNEVQYSNPCLLEIYNCQHQNDEHSLAYTGECHNCQTICPAIYAPVCAVDCNGFEVEYSNECALGVYNCQHQNDEHSLAYTGQCNNCQSVCPAIYEPVCSVDCDGNEVQYSNPCLLEIYNCQHQNDEHSLTYTGECHNCNVACLEIFDPICTVDGDGNEKTWGNECELESYNCRYPNDQYTLSYDNECNNCQTACTSDYSPVCSEDANGNEVQYSNICEFENYNCKHKNEEHSLLYVGECRHCDTVCLDIYKPVCASTNGDCYCSGARTFSNECELNSYNCKNPTKVLIKASDGECPAVNCKTLKCKNEENWVCAVPSGFNGKPSSFYNDCERKLHNCNNPENKYDFDSNGKCANDC